MLANHYGYAPYWGGSGLWGSGMYPVGIWGAGVNAVGTNNLDSVPEMPNTPSAIVAEAMQSEETQGEHGDPHLRSSREVAGYAIQALDEDIGHVDDFLVDDETWALRYVVVATRNWLPGKHVLVAPSWIRTISWEERAMHIDLTKEQIKSSPEYNPARMLNNDDMEALHAHYDRPPHTEVDLHK